MNVTLHSQPLVVKPSLWAASPYQPTCIPRRQPGSRRRRGLCLRIRATHIYSVALRIHHRGTVYRSHNIQTIYIITPVVMVDRVWLQLDTVHTDQTYQERDPLIYTTIGNYSSITMNFLELIKDNLYSTRN